MKNLEKYKGDLRKLIDAGDMLYAAIQCECNEDLRDSLEENLGDKAGESLDALPIFVEEYQAWYSESQKLVRQLLPDRLEDFCSYYESPRGRKEVHYGNYHISDYLIHLTRSTIVDVDAAIPRFRQQLAIVKAIRQRFESSLFDIRQVVRADLFDSELEAAGGLVRQGFLRAGGALAGVVMEKHLAQVCEDHGVAVRKRNPTIADYNQKLKDKEVIDTPRWRSNQYLGDIRNICDHHKDREPTKEELHKLLDGINELIKTLF